MEEQQYINKMVGLRELAKLLMRDNEIDRCIQVVIDFGKTKSFSGDGAFSFMSGLFRNCSIKQIKKVEWMFDECLPPLIDPMMKSLLRERKAMRSRLKC